LVINNVSYVIDWANQSFQWSNELADGSTISVSGELAPIFYNKTAGSTFIIYHSNVEGLWNPQPELQIQNATLTTQLISSVTTLSQSIGSTCTTTLTFTVSRPPNQVWNLPMVPPGACTTVRNMAPQESYTVGNVEIPIPVMVLASSVGGVGLIMFCALMFMKTRRKESRQ
jgi:disulfide bond formation protein DsbB